ncbi:parathyroid hormone [Lissotriton helveticus]
MLPIGVMAKVAVILCGIYFITRADGRPTRKRSVSEVQLMHNFGEHRHTTERQEWLQLQLLELYPDAMRLSAELQADQALSRGQRPRRKDDKWGTIRTRRLLPEQLQALQRKLGDLEQEVLDMIFQPST